MNKLTPMMQQYMEIKNKNKDSILFFRLGDFYEMFFDDAIKASRELEITLTERSVGLEKKAPMCGVPHHVADGYISKLVSRGYKVALCEQVEDPNVAKGIVKREVVKIITPGTITDENILDDKSNNYLAAIYVSDTNVGLSYVDNSTGELYTTELKGNIDDISSFIINEIGKISPMEILSNYKLKDFNETLKVLEINLNPYFNFIDNDDILRLDFENIKNRYFKKLDLKNFDPKSNIFSRTSLEMLFKYLVDTQKESLDHIGKLIMYSANDYLELDYNTRCNLEINKTVVNKSKKGSLIGFLDKTSTSMGGRTLKKWLEQPLLDINKINFRNNIVEFFHNNSRLRNEIDEILKNIYDIERLSSKISKKTCNGRDLISLKNSLSELPRLKKLLIETKSNNILKLENNIDDLRDIYLLIENSIESNPPISITEGNLIKLGFNENIDKLKEATKNGKKWLFDLEEKERKKTSINNLRIGYNKILGYYFEVTNSNIPKVPKYFIRKQTLTNSERYFTDELKQMENTILNAENNLLSLEYECFLNIREELAKHVFRIQQTSKILAKLDTLISFSKISYANNFIKPKINTEGVLDIKNGRHPVVEDNINEGLFVPNDSYLDLKENMIHIITGPNMAGKSTYMRQIAIITILAHIGSFVPADYANICLIDRIFTRIGASDNLSQGQSTFMVEMNEVANITKSATENSLIILDEVGRGTSTYDGLSIAWALIEYISDKIGAKTLFATHYHELTELESKKNNIQNLTIAAKEVGDEVVFLRKVIKGSTNKSYGIQVAKLAGLDNKIINRANEILNSIENRPHKNIEIREEKVIDESNKQMNFENYNLIKLIDDIKKIDINNLTPLEGLKILNQFVNRSIELGD